MIETIAILLPEKGPRKATPDLHAQFAIIEDRILNML
jgi:hypothetical protein